MKNEQGNEAACEMRTARRTDPRAVELLLVLKPSPAHFLIFFFFLLSNHSSLLAQDQLIRWHAAPVSRRWKRRRERPPLSPVIKNVPSNTAQLYVASICEALTGLIVCLTSAQSRFLWPERHTRVLRPSPVTTVVRSSLPPLTRRAKFSVSSQCNRR